MRENVPAPRFGNRREVSPPLNDRIWLDACCR